MSTVLLVGTDSGFPDMVRRAYGGSFDALITEVDTPADESADDLVDKLVPSDPDVVVLGPQMAVDYALETAEVLEIEEPQISVVLVLDPSADVWARALKAGVRDILEPDADESDVKATFDRALDVAGRHRENRVVTTVAPEAPDTRGRLIAVISPKGGSGKTTVASSLAVLLAQQNPDDVVLADLDLQFGDVANALRLDPEYTIAQAAHGRIDSTMLKGFLTPHASELLCLCAPQNPEDADDITAEQLQQLLAHLRESFRWVVVDTGAGLDEPTLTAVEQATDYLFVSATDVASVSALRKEIEIFDRMGMTSAARHFVLNRSDARVGLVPDDIISSVGMEPAALVPSSESVPLAMNQGEPIVLANPRSAVSDSIVKLANGFMGVQVDDSAKGFLGRLLK